MDTKILLEAAGLTGNEAKIYLALLDLGSALAGEITKRSGVNRTNVYDALDRLTEKGMASYVIQANRKYFEATEPKRIISYLTEKEKEIKDKKDLLHSIMPELSVRRKLGREEQEATIYRGRKGIKSIAEDILETKKQMLVFGAEGNFVEKFTHYAKQWHKRRGKLKIPIKIIFNEKMRKRKTTVKFPYSTMKFSAMMEESPATTWVYGDKIVIIVWSEQPIATLIRSKEVARSYKQFFDVLWKDSKA